MSSPGVVIYKYKEKQICVFYADADIERLGEILVNRVTNKRSCIADFRDYDAPDLPHAWTFQAGDPVQWLDKVPDVASFPQLKWIYVLDIDANTFHVSDATNHHACALFGLPKFRAWYKTTYWGFRETR